MHKSGKGEARESNGSDMRCAKEGWTTWWKPLYRLSWIELAGIEDWV